MWHTQRYNPQPNSWDKRGDRCKPRQPFMFCKSEVKSKPNTVCRSVHITSSLLNQLFLSTRFWYGHQKQFRLRWLWSKSCPGNHLISTESCLESHIDQTIRPVTTGINGVLFYQPAVHRHFHDDQHCHRGVQTVESYPSWKLQLPWPRTRTVRLVDPRRTRAEREFHRWRRERIQTGN